VEYIYTSGLLFHNTSRRGGFAWQARMSPSLSPVVRHAGAAGTKERIGNSQLYSKSPITRRLVGGRRREPMLII